MQIIEENKKTIKLWFFYESLVILIGLAFYAFIGAQRNAISFLFGGGVLIWNLSLFGLVLFSYMRKKSVAWPLLLIVFKYAVLGIVIYKSFLSNWFSFEDFFAGVSSLVVSTFCLSLHKQFLLTKTAKE